MIERKMCASNPNFTYLYANPAIEPPKPLGPHPFFAGGPLKRSISPDLLRGSSSLMDSPRLLVFSASKSGLSAPKIAAYFMRHLDFESASKNPRSYLVKSFM